MSHADRSATAGDQGSTGELVSQLSQEVSRLVRGELQLAKVEVSGRAKRVGIGAGTLGAAGLLALYGAGVLLAAAILALAMAVAPWLAALIVGVLLLAVAVAVAFLGKKRVQDATPLTPTKAVENIKADVEAVRSAH